MRPFLGGLAVVGLIAGEDLGICDNERRIQLLLVHDGSANYRNLFVSLNTNTQKFMDRLAEEWGPDGIHIAVSAFVDKPMPFRGWGDCCGVGEMDYCYMHFTGITSKASELKEGFGDLAYYVGSGGDYIENPYEGMLAAVNDPRNRMEEPGFAEDGKEVFRVMIMITDEIAHQEGDGQPGITLFNTKEDYMNEMGFWHPNFVSTGALYSRDKDHNATEEYEEMFNLHVKGYDKLTAAEKKSYDSLYSWWGPDTFADLMPHPGTTEAAEDCTRYEYPSAKQVVDALVKAKVTPHFMFGISQLITDKVKNVCQEMGHTLNGDKKKYQECLREYYPAQMKAAGYENEDIVTYAFNHDPKTYDELADGILHVLKSLSRPIPCEPVEPEDTTAGIAIPSMPHTMETTGKETTGGVVIPSMPHTMETTGGAVNPTMPIQTTGGVVIPSMPHTMETTGGAVNPTMPTMPIQTTGAAVVPTMPHTMETVPTIFPPMPTLVLTTTTVGGGVTTGGAVVPTMPHTMETVPTIFPPMPTMVFTTTTVGGGVPPTIPTIPGGNGGQTTTTTTEEAGGSNIGLIAGATGGSLAGLAAIGLLAYKKLGGALMGGGGSPNLAQDTEQVEIDESPVERETLEEVTMDMFQ